MAASRSAELVCKYGRVWNCTCTTLHVSSCLGNRPEPQLLFLVTRSIAVLSLASSERRVAAACLGSRPGSSSSIHEGNNPYEGSECSYRTGEASLYSKK